MYPKPSPSVTGSVVDGVEHIPHFLNREGAKNAKK
jgi:hypothetical protein